MKDEFVTKNCPACGLKFRYHFYPGLKHVACNYCKTDVAVSKEDSIPGKDLSSHSAHGSPAGHSSGGHGHH